LPLAGYAGRYADSLVGTVVIAEESGGLRLTQGSQLRAALDHWHFDTFRVTWENAWQEPDLVTFDLSAEGKVAAIHYGGRRLARVP
jgi:hypothetical protein